MDTWLYQRLRGAAWLPHRTPFTQEERGRLRDLRTQIHALEPLDPSAESNLDLHRLQFARWLVAHGRLSEELGEPSAACSLQPGVPRPLRQATHPRSLLSPEQTVLHPARALHDVGLSCDLGDLTDDATDTVRTALMQILALLEPLDR